MIKVNMSTDSKNELVAAVMRSGEEIGIASTHLHTVAAELLGIDIGAMKIVAYLRHTNSATMTEIVGQSGLTPGAATALVKRLVQKGFVIRTRDAIDGRKVCVRLAAEKIAAIDTVYRAFITDVNHMFNSFSAAELQVIQKYQQKMTDVMRRSSSQLSHAPGTANQEKESKH
ncbi:MAG TPA: MarR family transcriptional regulator [Candidatus Saccharimonadales bacterium]|nr:MarR family transcriptional regulator [Candidatus Saccharimonadales bacterium]